MTTNLSKYWKDRYKLEEKRRAKTDEELERKLDAIYKQHISEIKKEIDSFWQKYADKNGTTKLEAKKRADKLDMDVVSHKAGQLVARAEKMRKRGKKVTNKNFTKAENDLMKLYNLKMKTSRLEVLQANLKLHQYELAMNEWEATERHLIKAVRRENLYSAGILKETLGSYQTAKTSAETIVYTNFHGANWSERIWERQDALREIVRKSVADTIVRGKGTLLLIRQLEKEFNVSNAYARRLAITETARVYSEAQKANYKANDFVYYEILAESGACNICKPYDSKHYKVDDMTPGHNAPPFHPHCKCTTVPHFEREKPLDKAEEKTYNQDMFSMDLMAKQRFFRVGNDIRVKTKKLNGTDFDFWAQDNTKKIRDTVLNVQSNLKELNNFPTPTVVFLKKSRLPGFAGYDYKQDILFVSDALHSEKEFAKVLSDNYFAAQTIKDTMVHELTHKKHWDSAKAFYKANKKRYNNVEQAMSELNSPLVSYVKEQLKHDYNYLYNISDNAAIAFYSDNINELVAEVGVLGDRVTDPNLLNKVKEVLSWK